MRVARRRGRTCRLPSRSTPPPWAWGRGCAGASRRRPPPAASDTNNTTSTRGSAARDARETGHHPAHPIGEVTPADTDHVGDPAPSGRPGSSPPGPRCRQRPRCPRSPRTAFAKPRPTPPSARAHDQQPQVGRSPPSATSSSTGTLSLKSRTCIPTDSASASRGSRTRRAPTRSRRSPRGAHRPRLRARTVSLRLARGWRRWRWSGLRRSRTPREPARRPPSPRDDREHEVVGRRRGPDPRSRGRRGSPRWPVFPSPPPPTRRRPPPPSPASPSGAARSRVRAHVREPDARAHD